MAIQCPQCDCAEIRVHGFVHTLEVSRDWHGRDRIVSTLVARECSCYKCLYAFTVRNNGERSAAPQQTAHDQLKAVLDAAKAQQNGQTPKSIEHPPAPRPAPDPRVVRR